MIQTLMKNWWLLALCGLFEAAHAAVNLFTLDADGAPVLRIDLPENTAALLCALAIAAGLCAAAAGLLTSRRRSWPLVLDGAALSAYGIVALFLRHGRHGFLPFALLFAVMGTSIAACALASAPALRRHVPDHWCLRVAGAASAGFAGGFLILGLRFVRLEPEPFLVWMSSYFAFSALCMLGAGARLRGARTAVQRMAGVAPAV